MVIHFTPAQLRRNSDRPTAITGVLIAGSPSIHAGTSDITLGTPTYSARGRHGLWAMYAVGDGVVVIWPGGAMAGAPGEVAGELRRLDSRAYDDIDRVAVSAIRQFLTGAGDGRSDPADQPGRGGDHRPSSWPAAPARRPAPLVAVPISPGPDHAHPAPTPKSAPPRAA
jgi:hypothetical protein